MNYDWCTSVELLHDKVGGESLMSGGDSGFFTYSGPGSNNLEVAGSNPGSSWVAAGGSWVSFHPGFMPRFLICWSTDPNSNLSPVEKPPRYGNTAFVLPVGPSA